MFFGGNTLYTVSFNKLYVYHPQTGEKEYQKTFPVKRVNKLHIDVKGNTWLSADDGLHLLDAEGRFSCLVQGEFVSIFESSAHENTEAVHPIASANLKSLFYDHRQLQFYLGTNLNGFYSFSLHDHRVSRFYIQKRLSLILLGLSMRLRVVVIFYFSLPIGE